MENVASSNEINESANKLIICHACQMSAFGRTQHGDQILKKTEWARKRHNIRPI